MEKEKMTIKDWFMEHKKGLIIAGVCIVASVFAIIEIKNHTAVEEDTASLKKSFENKSDGILVSNTASVFDTVPVSDIFENKTVTADRIPHDVVGHLRNLPEGCKASEEKIATASEHGFALNQSQTWVKPYRTGNLFR